MKKIRINNFKEHLYYEKLSNGLEVFIVPNKTKKKFKASLTVKYGSSYIKFRKDNKIIETPTGIAHFLEHKMFERKETPFDFYSKFGTDVNAYTNLDATTYHFTGSKCFKKSLSYLLNWIKSLDITEEQVEKEKGIILEEASMYKDNPSRLIYEKARENVFVKDPMKHLVIGIDEDIKRITKKELDTCYNTFYVPNNMFLVITGNINPNEAIKQIREETKDYKRNKDLPKKERINEPDRVNKEYEEIKNDNVEIPQISVAYKMNKNLFKDLKLTKFELDLYLNCLINIALGATSEIRQKWVENNMFLNSFFQLNDNDTHYVLCFLATSTKIDKLYNEFKEYINNLKTDEESFKREIKQWIAAEVLRIENPIAISYSITDELLDYGKITYDKIKVYKSLNYKTLEKVKQKLDFTNESVIKMTPNK